MKPLTIIFYNLIFLFTLVSQGQKIKGTYAIKNVKTGMLLRIKDANDRNGTPLVAYNPQNWKCMTWEFQNKGGDTYQLKNLYTNKTFQPLGQEKDHTIIEQQPLVADASNQKYEFIEIKKDVYLIRLRSTELYLTPADPEGSTNSAILLTNKKDALLQQWTIYPQNPTM